MKFIIDRETVTLAKLDEAKATLAEYKQYHKDGLFDGFFGNAVAADSRFDGRTISEVISIETCEITLNHFEITAWITGWVKVGYDLVALVSFDGKQAMQYSEDAEIDSYIQVYKRLE